MKIPGFVAVVCFAFQIPASLAALVGSYDFEGPLSSQQVDLANPDGTATPYDPGRISGSAVHVSGHRGAFAMSFDGSSAYLNLGTQDMGRAAPGITLASWIKVRSFPADIASLIFLSRFSSRIEARAVLDITSNGQVEAGGRAGDAEGFQSRVSVAPLALDEWTHLVGVLNYAARTIEIFINGSPQAVTGGAINFAATTADTDSRIATIGSTGGIFEFFDGEMDEVRIFNHALTETQVAAVYAGTWVPPGDAPPQIALAKLRASYPSSRAKVKVSGRISSAAEVKAVTLRVNGKRIKVSGLRNWSGVVQIERPGIHRVRVEAITGEGGKVRARASFRVKAG